MAIRSNCSVGDISDLSSSQSVVLKALVRQTMDNWDLIQKTGLSESSVIKALRVLKARGLVIRESNRNMIPPKMLKRIREE